MQIPKKLFGFLSKKKMREEIFLSAPARYRPRESCAGQRSLSVPGQPQVCIELCPQNKIHCRHFLLFKHKEPVDQRAATGPILLSRRGNMLTAPTNLFVGFQVGDLLGHHGAIASRCSGEHG